jgi:hypothetical protein
MAMNKILRVALCLLLLAGAAVALVKPKARVKSACGGALFTANAG